MFGLGWDVNDHLHLRTKFMLRGGWGGVGWDINDHSHLTTKLMLRGEGGGVGWEWVGC